VTATGRTVRAAAAVLVVAALGGCDRSCAKLADRLCERASLSGDKNAAEQCDKWRDRARRVSKETCQAGLRALEQEHFAGAGP